MTPTPIGAADIDRLKARLDAELSRLKNEINAELAGADQSRFSGVIDTVRDRGDESVADLYADLEFTQIERRVDRLRLVENALHRVDNGVYGICVDCAEAIQIDRLKADPAAFRCMACQTLAENNRSEKDATPSL